MLTLPIRSQLIGHPRRSNSRRPQIELMEPRTLLSAVAWTGGAGDSNWDTPANWDTNSVPGSTDDVTINIAANVVHSSDISDSINSLTSSQPLTIAGGTLSIAAASTIGNTLTINGGTLTGTGDVSVSGLVTLTAGTLAGSSSLNADGGMLINSDNDGPEGSFILDGRTVNNAAGQTATWIGDSGDIDAFDGSIFNNFGAFLVDGLGFYSSSGIGAASSFVNEGTFTMSGNSGNMEFSVPFNVPGGSVNVTAMTRLDLDQGGSSTGAAFNIDPEGALGFGYAYTFDATTTITGGGTLLKSGLATLALPGDYTFTGFLDVQNGTLKVDGSIAGAAVSVEFGTLSGTGTVGQLLAGAGAVSVGDNLDPGILYVQGDVDFAGLSDEGEQLTNFIVTLNGPTAGTDYSQLNATGEIDLEASSLSPSLGFVPANGESFTIMKSTRPIVGTFDGLPEGAPLMIDDTPFTISYVGGDGNDIVLTQAVATEPPVTAAPTVTGVTPTSGPAAGGTLVTITGTGLTGASAVDFGAKEALNFTVVSETTITADSPVGTDVVNVTVVTPGGTSATSAADQFTYAAIAAPKVTGISPDSGPATGGTQVTITGIGFTGATAVEFGTTAATAVTVVSATTITASSPAGTGRVDVTVFTPAGTSAASAADQFTFTAAATPTVTSVARFGFHMQLTSVVLTFSSALDPKRATDVNNYQIITMGGRGRNGALVGHITHVCAVIYDPTTLTVTLHTAQRLDIHNAYRLTVKGAVPGGLRVASGVALVGKADGLPGSDYVAVITGKLLAGPAPGASAAARKEWAAHRQFKKVPRSSAVYRLMARRSPGGLHHLGS